MWGHLDAKKHAKLEKVANATFSIGQSCLEGGFYWIKADQPLM